MKPSPRSRTVLRLANRNSLRLLLSGMAVALPSCDSFEITEVTEVEPPALARARPADWGYASIPASCASSADDDVCVRCEKKACCTEIEACDANCMELYRQYQECLYPTPGVAWSGLGSAACKQRVSASATSSATAVALIDCAASACSTTDTCGVEPRAVFAFPTQAPTNDFSAAEFLESYCAGCHFQGFLGPTGKPTSALSRDPAWWSPRWNADWFAFMDYDVAVEKAPAISCGVAKDYFASECLTLASVPTGFFTEPGKFPPSGHGLYSGAPNPCRFAPDGTTCPQPTDFERARMLSWLADGAPR
jgi:hypothetical protein